MVLCRSQNLDKPSTVANQPDQAQRPRSVPEKPAASEGVNFTRPLSR